MNEHEIERIAAAVNVLRPDWPTNSLRTLIATKLGNRPRRDVMVALAWIACEPNTATPARVVEAGPWWRAAAAGGESTNTPPRLDQACRLCGRHTTTCLCDDEPTTRPIAAVPPTSDYQTARQELRSTP